MDSGPAPSGASRNDEPGKRHRRPQVAAFAARCREGHWLTIAGAGHNVQEDEPLALATALRNFIGAASISVIPAKAGNR
jgi:pimeloyl-ACP methyl ester carboxylesterase